MQLAGVTGKYEHNMDAKGRLFIPAKFREYLGAHVCPSDEGDESLNVSAYISIGKSGCLVIYTQASWAKVKQIYSEAVGADKTALRDIFYNTFECEPDSQGRIVIPQELRDYAKLEKEVVITGANDTVEIWQAAKWRELYGAPKEENVTSILEKLGL